MEPDRAVRRYDNIAIPLGGGREMLDKAVRVLAGQRDPVSYRVVRKSVDARDKNRIRIVYSVETGPMPVLAGLTGRFSAAGNFRGAGPGTGNRPVVVGTGPAGLFAGLALALAGLRPILLEQGRDVDTRSADVARFWSDGHLDPWSNVQFGEGGAGTFSDGKLTTGIRDERVAAVFQEFVMAGAPEEILYLARPHIGTDRLHGVVRNIRRRIESLGGEYRFGRRFCGAGLQDGRVRSVLSVRSPDADGLEGSAEETAARQVVLAIGHSARSTYPVLRDLGLAMEPKAFSAGVRIEHPQSLIDRSQYGRYAGHPELPPAEYKLSCHLGSGRSVYTFCMCPGGLVVAAASEPGRIVTNGMSVFARDGAHANSALLVSVGPADFPDDSALGGIAFQAAIEEAAFRSAGSDYRAPVQTVGGLLPPGAGSARADGCGPLAPTCRPGTAPVPLDAYLPGYIVASLREALPVFGRKIQGFDHPDALLTGPETRSSSPVRILRDASGRASVTGFYPCGEGAGYAGGIVSSAVDGIRAAESLIRDAVADSC